MHLINRYSILEKDYRTKKNFFQCWISTHLVVWAETADNVSTFAIFIPQTLLMLS